MKTKLITALRTAAKALENGTFEYDWEQPQSCNCGIIACALMGKSIVEMKALVLNMRSEVAGPNWKLMVRKFCPITGVPTNEVFKALVESGMSATDIIELEELSNKKVLRIGKLKDVYKITTKISEPNLIQRLLGAKPKKTKTKELQAHYTSKENAIKYMRAWADILEEEGKDDVVLHNTTANANIPA